jgi:uncharacterized protein (TIGR02266 family)
MRIKLKYSDVETFIQKYAVNISRGGIFIATKQPKAVGTPLKFEFVLAVGEPGISVIRGEGQVLWTREFDPSQPNKAHGMGVKFTRLDAESQAIIDRALAFRASQAQIPRDEGSAARPLPKEPSQVAPPPSPLIPPIVQPALGDTTTPTPLPVAMPPPSETTGPTLLPEATGPTSLPEQPMGRAPNEDTRPLPVSARGREDVTRPITVEQAEREITRETQLPRDAPPPRIPEPRFSGVPRVKVALENDPSREIRIRGGSRGAALEELEEIAREWGVDEAQIERILKRRRPRMVEATAELERLLRKPAKPPTPSKAEALAGLREILQKRAPVLEIDRRPQAQASGGIEEPIKKVR